MVPKWNMPNATKMSALAYRTFNTVVEHLGVVHMPTFRLEVCVICPLRMSIGFLLQLYRMLTTGSFLLCVPPHLGQNRIYE